MPSMLDKFSSYFLISWVIYAYVPACLQLDSYIESYGKLFTHQVRLKYIETGKSSATGLVSNTVVLKYLQNKIPARLRWGLYPGALVTITWCNVSPEPLSFGHVTNVPLLLQTCRSDRRI